MMRRDWILTRVSQWAGGAFAVFVLAVVSLEAWSAELPRLFPDYTGVTLPPNIAPLNFKILEPAASYRVELRSSKGPSIAISSSNPEIRVPPKTWARLLRDNPGQPFYWDISVRSSASIWTRLATITNHIAREEIDGWIAYRLLKPIYNYYTQLGIYQRNLETFLQKPILLKDTYGEGCLNCHTPLSRNPDTFAFNIRAHEGQSPTIMVLSNQVTRVEQTMGYLAWHPSGRWLASTANKLSLLYHTRGEPRDVYDAKSDLRIYDVLSNSIVFPPAIALPDKNESWPAWSPDGRYLYFSRAHPQSLENLKLIRYDLMRAGFDPLTGQWGSAELILSSEQTGQSICQPKISPDGRFLLVTLCENGSFPIFKTSSDLYVMDLSTRQFRRLDINSNQADTWHSWSSNGRWVVFSSKRIDGLLARPYFSFVDESGQFHKPFLLPQEDPSFYGFCLQTFNVPEFMTGPVTVPERHLAEAITSPRRAVVPQGPSAPVSPGSPPTQDQSEYQHVRE